MDKNFAVSLPRIQRNSAEHLNKLDNSAFVYSINLNILSSSAAANVSLTNSLIEYIPSLKRHK
ncbi:MULTISPECIES: hypothetical protein [Prevotella]|uniref:hypothetical protein n=1 Tax=Prevotella herbatica TaxID=2801997 RepID=UPI001A913070|nr:MULTISPECIES: hypothetical protein [Prevotella]